MKNRYIPLKNYAIALMIVVIVICLAIYSLSWYNIYLKEQTRESYLIKTNTVSMQITNIKDIDTILSEAPSSYYIFIGFRNSNDELKLEKKLKSVIDNYGLNDSFYYLDATSIKTHSDYLNELNTALKIDDNSLKNLPAIIYYKDGNVNKIINSSNDKMFNIDTLKNLISKNESEKLSQ